MNGPGSRSADTTLAYETGTINESSAIEHQTSGHSYKHSVSLRNITPLLEEQLTNRQIYYEGSSSYINDTNEESAEINDTYAFEKAYVTNTEQMVTTDSDSEYTEHTSEYQKVPENDTDKINLQRVILSENSRNFGNNDRNFTVPKTAYNHHGSDSELSYKNATNIIISMQETEPPKIATARCPGTMRSRAKNTHQITVTQKTFEPFESSTEHTANNVEGLLKRLSREEEELNETVKNTWSYTEHFLTSGDLQVGKKAINLMQNYVEHRRHWIRHMQLIPPDSVNVSGESLSYRPLLLVKVRQLNETESTLHMLQDIYRLATIVKTNETRFRNYSETHNNSADLSFVLEAEKYLNDLEISIRELEAVWQEYSIKDYFEFPWNSSVHLVSERNNLKAINKSIHEAYLFALKKKVLEETFQYYIYPGFYFVILVFGAVGNGALLLIFVKYKDIRTAPNIMVFNLALMDIMNLAANAPLYYISKYHSQWIYLEGYGCRVFATFRFLNHSVIEFSIVGLSIQRYCAVMATLRNPTSQWRSAVRCRTTMFMLVVWLIALVVSLPPSLVYEFPSGICFPLATPQIKALNVFYFALYSFVLPVTLVVFSVITAHKLKQSVSNIPGELVYRSQEVSRYRSAKVVTALAISYVITHIPRSIWFFLVSFFHLDRREIKYIPIDEVTNYLIFANSCLNPLALYISSGKFRQLFKRHLCCVRQKERPRAPLERQVTASSSTRLVCLIESYAEDLAGHKTSLKGLNNFTKNYADVNINPNTQ
ncbi:hypothetical protein Cfor_03568 [Coptotermes formosanus]|jgi:hypothetical protein|uniref:G-protein coupled receptors family 1 profile domain-containing protein n=1 Tax=Coptotermes formosanus TaxID=36987 RepID=A0A6L2Q270_COPFO|nr:hypothetical protein Cfor_03568 [Coptotermes formosanus]